MKLDQQTRDAIVVFSFVALGAACGTLLGELGLWALHASGVLS